MLARIAAGESVDDVHLAHAMACPACEAALVELRENERFMSGAADLLATPARARRGEITDGDSIPGYRLLGEIHRGAQGAVYKAYHEPTRRFLAIKMLLQGAFATARQRARFEREIEIAALLRHPNIVTLYETGALPGGRVGYVMEFVDGVPLDEWVARGTPSRLPPRERHALLLRTLMRICDAIRHAHERGIIHRDLKPANILVDREDQPRILDFGLAKALGAFPEQATGPGPGRGERSRPGLETGPVGGTGVGPRAGAAHERTQVGEICGTFAYAAPEQLSGDPSRIDTRTDVYSLGMIAYELLVGAAPYELHGDMAEVSRTITEVDPPRPSRRVRGFSRDLEVILLKALSKEPARRYANAGSLLDDLERHERGDIVIARRDSSWYVLRRTARRHRMPFVVAAMLVVVAVVLMSMLAVHSHRIGVAHAIATDALRQSDLLRARALSRGGSVSTAEAILWDIALLDASVSGESTAPHWPGRDDVYWELVQLASQHRCISAFHGGAEPLRPIVRGAMSPDGSMVATGDEDGWVHLFELDAPRRRWSGRGSDHRIIAIEFSGDGATLATGDSDSAVRLWRTRDGAQVGRFGFDTPDAVYRVVPIVADDGWIVASSNGTIATISSTGALVDIRSVDPGLLRRGAIDTMGCRIALVDSERGRVRIGRFDGDAIDLESEPKAEVDPEWLDRFAEPLMSASFLDGGAQLGVVIPNIRIGLFDSTTGELHGELPPGGNGDLEQSSSGRLLGLGDRNNRAVSLFRVGSKELPIVRLGHAAEPTVLGFVDGRDGTTDRVVSMDRSGEIRIWETDTTPWPRLMIGHADTVFALAARTGKSELIPELISASNDRTVRIWNGDDHMTRTVLTGHSAGALSVAISDDGARLATGGHDDDCTIRLWDLSADPPTLLRTLEGHASHIHTLAFRPDGRVLASGAGHGDDTLRLWDLDSGETTWVLQNEPDVAVYCAAFAPGRDVLMWCDRRGRIVRRDAAGRGTIESRVRIIEAGRDAVRAFALSSDGTRFASVGDDTLVRVWDTDTSFDTGEALLTLHGHSGPLYAVAWSPDGRLLASGGSNGEIHIRNATTGRLLLELDAHTPMIFSLLFVDGGDTLIAGGSTPEIAVYDLRAFDRHIAGQLELQIARRTDRIDPARVASLRRWAAEVLGRAVDDAEKLAAER